MGKDQKPEGKRRYRLVFVNERKDKTVFSFSMPLWVVTLLFGLLLMLSALLAILIVVRTPLRAYLPGYLDVTKRAEVVEVARRLDSLEVENRLRSAYLNQLTQILRQDGPADAIVSYDSAVVRFDDSLLLAASRRETTFREQYEQRTRFALDVLQGDAAQEVLFLPPARGVLAADSLIVGREQAVVAPFDGTIVTVDFLLGEGYKVVMQHADDYIVVMSRLTKCFCTSGQVVKAGTALGHAGSQRDEADRWLGLSVWHKGYSVDPKNVMQL